MKRKKRISMRCIMVVFTIVAMVIMLFGNVPGKINTINAADNPYLTFTGEKQFKLSVSGEKKIWDGKMEYSTDTVTWTEWDGKEISSKISETNADQYVLYLRGENNTYVSGEASYHSGNYHFVLSEPASCSGNIMTLLNYENPSETITKECAFAYLFLGCNNLTSAPELPAKTLAGYCYKSMFLRCTGLTSAPELPAKALARECYLAMFLGCTGLTSAPELPAETLADSCYYDMFYGCKGLTSVPELQAETLSDWCYASMFQDCTGLTSVPELPAKTLSDYCYLNMFSGCTNIHISETNDTTDMEEFRIPKEGTGTAGTNSLTNMFKDTGGPFTGTPNINKTYYFGKKTITAEVKDNNVTYDGNPHGITISVTAPTEGATIKYGLTKENCNLSECPTITNVSEGPKNVYYIISAYGYFDYAGETTLTINPADSTAETPTNLTATYGQTLADVELPDGWSWSDNTLSVGNAGTNSFKADYTSTDTNYKSKSDVDISVNVGKGTNSITKAPTGKTLKYSGSKQELIEAGKSASGNMMYTVSENSTTAPTSGWSASIPTEEKAGTYYIWYKAGEDNNHNESKAECVTSKILAPISRKVVFKVSDGAWNDGTTEDKIVTLTGYEGDTLKLSENQIPKTGNKPADGYLAGTWDKEPDANTVITNDTTYTYSYKEKEKEPESPSYSEEWVDGFWYNVDGSQTYKYKGNWKMDETGWWYEDEKGWYPVEQWQKIDSKWYYFDETGYMLTNQYAGKWDPYSEGNWWVGDDGAWDGSEPGRWRLSNGKWYFSDKSGWYAKDGWYRICGGWYKFDSDGWMIEEQ